MDNDTRWLITQEIPHLRRFARSLVYQPEQADDLVQDALERGLKKRHLWQAHKGSMRTWLFKVLYNVHLNNVKSKDSIANVPLDSLPESVTTQKAGLDDHLHCKDILQKLARLPQEQREAIVLVALEEMPYDEAAHILGIKVGTLRSRLSRGRAAMRSYNKVTEIPVNKIKQAK